MTGPFCKEEGRHHLGGGRDDFERFLESEGCIPVPDTVEGYSLVSDAERDHRYCEHYEDERAMRMVRADRWKLIWYSVGNRFQLFALEAGPREMHDVAQESEYPGELQRCKEVMQANLHRPDTKWVRDGRLVG